LARHIRLRAEFYGKMTRPIRLQYSMLAGHVLSYIFQLRVRSRHQHSCTGFLREVSRELSRGSTIVDHAITPETQLHDTQPSLDAIKREIHIGGRVLSILPWCTNTYCSSTDTGVHSSPLPMGRSTPAHHLVLSPRCLAKCVTESNNTSRTSALVNAQRSALISHWSCAA
jgi:hypothetical protein